MAEAIEDASNWDALFKAFVMIVVSEIGDKTFLIAAIMASRHSRTTVFAGAFASLVVMSVLSAALGKVILGFIPKTWTLWAAAILFIAFGIKMFLEARSMSSSHMTEEMREVEEELEHDTAAHDMSNPRGMVMPLEDLEEGGGAGVGGSYSPRHSGLASPRSASRASASGKGRSPSPRRPLSGAHRSEKAGKAGQGVLERMSEMARGALQTMVNPVFAQAFILTFLGEWGDRSQIATITMGGTHSIPVIAFGTILGHGICTFGAVMGGRYLSTKISVKWISLIGAGAFLIFGALYAVEAYHTPLDARTGDDVSW